MQKYELINDIQGACHSIDFLAGGLPICYFKRQKTVNKRTFLFGINSGLSPTFPIEFKHRGQSC